MTVRPAIGINEAFSSYILGANLALELEGVITQVRVMELQLTAENGRWAFFVELGKGGPWLRVDLDAGEDQVAEVVKTS